MDIQFTQLTEPTTEYMDALNKWDNDPALVPLIHVNQNQDDLNKKTQHTLESLKKRLEYDHTWLIRLGGKLIGEVGYQIDPPHLYKKEPGTAWIGITIGEEVGRGKGIGFTAIQYLEKQIKGLGLKRVELGVFEFNVNAIKLYKKLGYQEIVRIENFTFWQDKMWQDVRMEKYL